MFSSLHRSLRGPQKCTTTFGIKRNKEYMLNLFGLLNPKQIIGVAKKRNSETMLFRKESQRRDSSFSQGRHYYRGASKCLRQMLFLVLHFALVVAVLCIASFAFSQTEDPTPETDEMLLVNSTYQPQKSDAGDKMMEAKFWDLLETRYNVDVSKIDKIAMTNDWKVFLNDVSEKANHRTLDKQRGDRVFIHKKWFYFSTIASTTVGYGDVAPITKKGRLVYIIFSIIAIPLMLSFIVSCGDKIRLLHTGLLSMLRQCISGHKKSVNEHLISSILMFISFAGHISVGCALFQGNAQHQSTVDKIYRHVVTFTTVGFGDDVASLETQVFNLVPLFFYRVFGFALLFGALKSLYLWFEARHEALAVLKLTQRPLKSQGRISTLLCCRPKLREEPKLESTMLI